MIEFRGSESWFSIGGKGGRKKLFEAKRFKTIFLMPDEYKRIKDDKVIDA